MLNLRYHAPMSKQTVAMIVQCLLAIICASIVRYSDLPDRTPPLILLISGIGGSWLLMKLYVLVRYGWKAMKSMTWDAD